MDPTSRTDNANSNAGRGVSLFGGHPLRLSTTVKAARSEAVAAGGETSPLGSLAIHDVEQFLAIASIPGSRDELRRLVGMEDQEFEELLVELKTELPPARAELVSHPAPAEFGTGAMQPDPGAFESAAGDAAASAPVAALPGSVNLIPLMAAIRNQGQRGTCVAFTLTALNEYARRGTSGTTDLSEQHLYHEIKLIDGSPQECGTTQAWGSTVLRTRGECAEVTWPYNPALPCTDPAPLPAAARPAALKYRLNTIAVPQNDVNAYKSHLAQQRPIGISFPVYNSWYLSEETRRSGRITMRVGNEVRNGGHAVLLVGYKDDSAAPGGGWFLFRNSWSTQWGYQSPYGAGYGVIPYAYIQNEVWEAFTAAPVAGEGEPDTNDITVDGPTSMTIRVGRSVVITIQNP